jgi:branched-chain amino acid transport system substrate-binding protein
MGRLRLVALAAALGVSGCLAACGSTTGGGGTSGGGPIKVGVPVPLSGEDASAGEDILNGAKLAATDINAKGGAGGHQIQILSEDDACDAQTAAQAADKLVSSGIAAAAGGYCSTAALPELTTFHRHGLAFVMDASTNPQLTEMGYREAFRTIGRDDEQGPFAAGFISGYLKAKTAAVVNDNSTYSKGLADSTVAALKKDQVDVVLNDSLQPGQSDYTPILTRIKAANPQVFYYTGYYADEAKLLKQGHQIGLNTTYMAGDANNDPTLIQVAGPAAEGAYITTAPLAQFLSGAKSYVDEYQKTYGKGPGPYSVYEYDAVQAVARAVQAAGSTEPAKIVDAMHSLKPFQGLTGTIAFRPNGDRQGVVYIVVTIRNGQFTPFKKLSGGTWVNA